jgi:hypothetical protein
MTGPPSPAAVDEDVKHAIKGLVAKGQEAARRDRAKAEMYEKMIQAQMLRLNNEFGVLNCRDGDTLIYIGPPPQTMSKSQTWDYAYNQTHFSPPHRVHSSKFLGLNSKRFHDHFGPRSIRTERRLRKEGILSRISTEGIKYFVDLRPPTEDEEAVVLLTSLTCTKGVLTWHTARDKYGLAPMLVEGQDDSSLIQTDSYLPVDPPADEKEPKDGEFTNSEKTSNANKASWDKEKAGGQEVAQEEGLNESDKEENDPGLQIAIASSLHLSAKNPNSPKGPTKESLTTTSTPPGKAVAILPEYSPLRHRSAIERLVQTMENADPKLDSAPKVWTFFAVAKYFDCASHERISGWITKWLLSYPNCNFIQSNPEVALRIGLGTQSENITKDAFSILAGEKSLLNVLGESYPAALSPLVQSVHGRKLELLDDDERNRIDHAAASLVRRIRQRFDELVGEEMAWLHESSYYRKIFSLETRSPEEADVVNQLSGKIKQFVRGRIIWVLCRSYDADFGDFEQSLENVRTFYPGTKETFRETYNQLNERERIFTRFFWTALNQESLDDGAVNLWTAGSSKLDQPRAWTSHLSQIMLDRTMPSGERWCQIVAKKEVDTLIKKFNEIAGRQSATKMQTARQNVCPTPAVWPAEQEVSSRPGQIPNTAQQESRSAWAYFKGFTNPYDQSSKREQRHTPPVLLKEKRRKLSDADVEAGPVVAPSSEHESLPIRSRERNVCERDEALLQSSNSPVQHACSESPVNPTVLAPSCSDASEPGATRENIASPTLESFVSPINDSNTQSGAYHFGYDDSRARNFQPNLPTLQSLPGSGLSMKDVTYQQHVADMSLRPNLHPHNYGNQFSEMMSDGYDPDSQRVDQSRRMTAADHPYDRGDGTPGPVVTAADWSLPGDDIDWTETVVMQQFSDRRSSQSTYWWPEYLLYTDLFHDLSLVLHRICDEIITPAHLFHGDNMLPTNLIDTLMCLNEDEWKYLPLWAGGNDDGTGGVFDEVDVPNLEAGGFRGGKRGIGSVRSGDGDSSASESSFDDIGGEAISTVGQASKAATDGTQTVRSLSDIGSEDEGFMRQNELWDEIRDMKIEEARPIGHGTGTGVDKGKARTEDVDSGIDDDMDGGDVDDVDTVVAAGLTDGDGGGAMDEADPRGVSGWDDEGSDDDMEIIDADDL